MATLHNLRLAALAAREHTAGSRERRREPLDADWILQELLGLQVSTWSYEFEPADVVRCGVMAQEFYRAYRFGSTDKRIPVESAIGVLTVSIQVLARRLESAASELAQLRQAGVEHPAHSRRRVRGGREGDPRRGSRAMRTTRRRPLQGERENAAPARRGELKTPAARRLDPE